jgi:hypothetical protein
MTFVGVDLFPCRFAVFILEIIECISVISDIEGEADLYLNVTVLIWFESVKFTQYVVRFIQK